MTGAAGADALSELLGLNKSPNLNLGDAVGLAAGLAVASGCAFLRGRLALGDAVGDSAAVGEAAVSVGETVASALLCWRCFFAGEGDSAGISAGTATWACTTQVLARPITETSNRDLVIMSGEYRDALEFCSMDLR
jgi:hypothetical protein